MSVAAVNSLVPRSPEHAQIVSLKRPRSPDELNENETPNSPCVVSTITFAQGASSSAPKTPESPLEAAFSRLKTDHGNPPPLKRRNITQLPSARCRLNFDLNPFTATKRQSLAISSSLAQKERFD